MNKPEIKPLAYPIAPLKAALAEFDANQPGRDYHWNNVTSNEEVAECQAADLEALNKVRVAFHEVTKDRNCLENCMRVDIDFMRKIASKY